MLNNLRFLAFFSIFFIKIYPQVSSAIDTVYYESNSSIVQLKNKFIDESSLIINGGEVLIKSIKVFPLNGQLLLPDTIISQRLIIKYDYLTSGLPIIVGPKWKTLPKLNLIKEKNNLINSQNRLSENEKVNSVISNGSIYRNINISPMGGANFSGGLQMQINGKISKDIAISGILNDQDFPIQPDGSTRELDELDNVYLKIMHNNFDFDVGDIFYEHYNINRKLVGIKNEFNFGELQGSSIYANSRGNFRYLEIKGRDGDQGPYQLIGNNGNSDIIILADTEKVWHNGKKLTRGLNYDYIIDYSTAEVTFNPIILIDFDSDLVFEYQYSDYGYQKGFSGGNIKKIYGDSRTLEIGFYNEDDRYYTDDMSEIIFDSLSLNEKGPIQISTSTKNPLGEYYFENGFYIYDPLFTNSNEENRFDVVFQYDLNGNYQRKISSNNRVYYEVVKQENKDNILDLYSPYKNIYSPTRHQLGYIDYDYKINDNIQFKGNLSASSYNENRLYNGKNKLGVSYSYGIGFDSLKLGIGSFSINLKNSKRSIDYNSMGHENDVRHTRFWNLDSSIINGLDELTLQSEFSVNKIGSSSLEFSRLYNMGNKNTRLILKQELSNNILKNSYYDFIYVKGQDTYFTRSEAKLNIPYGIFSPFVSFLSENDSTRNLFWKSGVGLSIHKNSTKIVTGFDYRVDKSLNGIELIHSNYQDYLAYFQYRTFLPAGVRQKIIYKKRIKNKAQGDNFNYSLFDIEFRRSLKNKPLRWQVKFKQEQTLIKQRTTVYDSVGYGLGQYRYDNIFNTYIPDPNGAFVAYTIFTGSRKPNSVFQGSQDVTYEFSGMKRKSNFIIRSNAKQEFRGENFTINNLFNPDINDSLIYRSYMFNRYEFMRYGKKRILLWLEYYKNLNGMDPRGNDYNRSNEIGLELHRSFSKISSINNRGVLKSYSIESTISEQRNRSSLGSWNELQIQSRLSSAFNVDVGFIFGSEVGTQQGQNFSGKAYGVSGLINYMFKGNGRLQAEVKLVNVEEQNNLSYLPPEAFEGNPIGLSMKINSNTQFYINQTISIILSVNMIDNSRYDNFITFQGEVRGYF